jgi:hypothetical protein
MSQNNEPNSNSFNIIIDEYNEYMYNYNKAISSIKKSKHQIKIESENMTIPTIYTYNEIPNYNYNLQQLKTIAKNYKLKISGNKKELTSRIYEFLHLSFYIIKIQKIARGFLHRKFISLYGPAFKNRKLCTNETDFVTMDELKELPYYNFFSYMDADNFIYGFDIVSLYNLISKDKNKLINDKIQNPYNRNIIPDKILRNISRIIKFNKMFRRPLNLDINNDEIIENIISKQKMIELRALSLFQNIDSLGNYSNPQWFLSLDRNLIVKFIRELADIWNFRTQLSAEIKQNICPPNGDPFRNLSITYLFTEVDMNNVKRAVLEVLEKLVNTGINNDMKTLGDYYILGALTLVNETAASALPWLYQSLIYQ